MNECGQVSPIRTYIIPDWATSIQCQEREEKDRRKGILVGIFKETAQRKPGTKPGFLYRITSSAS